MFTRTLFSFIFLVCALILQATGDVCTDAIPLTVDDPNSCGPFDLAGATDSGLPRFSCGWPPGHNRDLWFSAVVPANGNLTIEASEVANGMNEVFLQAYVGDCNTPILLACSREKDATMNSYFGKIELENRPGETIWIRATGYTENDETFNICVTSDGYSYPCRIELVEIGAQSVCDPATNNFTQEFTVHYRHDGSVNELHINGQQFNLTGSPQTETITLPAHGDLQNIDMRLAFDGNDADCSANSNYAYGEAITAPIHCVNPPSNDECSGAILLVVNQACNWTIGDNTGATHSMGAGIEYNFECNWGGYAPQDVWFSFIVPANGIATVQTQMGSGADGLFEIYREVNSGDCSELFRIMDCAGNAYDPSTYNNLNPGETIYIRVADSNGDQQGTFEICVTTPPTNDTCDGAINIAIDGSCNLVNMESASASGFPDNRLSCGWPTQGIDLWYTIDLPADWLSTDVLKIESFMTNTGMDIDDLAMELYSGDCTNGLTSLICNEAKTHWNNHDRHAKIEITDRSANEILYLRVLNENFDFPGNFELCVSEISAYEQACKIEFIELVGTPPMCDPVTNTFTQEIRVHYRSDGSINMLHVNGSSYDLEPSPQTVTATFPATGNMMQIEAYISQNYDWTECLNDSRYFVGDFFQAPANCFSGTVTNDDCGGSTTLTVGQACDINLFDNIGATPSIPFDADPSSDPNVMPYFQCHYVGDYVQDVWFDFELPSDGTDVIVNTWQPDGSQMQAVFEIFEGSCGSLQPVIQCGAPWTSLRIPGVVSNPPKKLYIRVAEDGGNAQGEFGICVYQIDTFTPDDCGNPFPLLVSSDCSAGLIFSDHFANAELGDVIGCDDSGTGDPSQDVWFSVFPPSSGSLTIFTEEIENGGSNMVMEIYTYTGDCNDINNLNAIACNSHYGNHGHPQIALSGQDPNTELLIRVAANGNWDKSGFKICALSATNDECVDAISVMADGSCNVFNNFGATPSFGPSVPEFSCIEANTPIPNTPLKDVWFKTTVPASGNLDIETQDANSGLFDTIIEVYEGACGALNSISCSTFHAYENGHGHVILEGLNPGNELYIRIADDWENREGEFQLCITDTGFLCKIDNVEILSQGTCDPTTNTYPLNLRVHYRNDGSANELYSTFLWSETLTSSPMDITLDVPANGNTFDLYLELRNNGDRRNECSFFSRYEDLSITAESGCGSNELDECVDAYELIPGSTCIMETFNNIGSTMSSNAGLVNNNECVEHGNPNTQDIWFKITSPNSESINLDREFISVFPQFEIYSGTCNALQFESCELLSFIIPAGETRYIRVFDWGSNQQGEFNICAFSDCPDEEHISDDLIDQLHFEDHIKISADNLIRTGANVEYDAGNHIELDPGFEVENGAMFHAYIDGCYDEALRNPVCPIPNDKFVGDYQLSFVGSSEGAYQNLPMLEENIVNLSVAPLLEASRVITGLLYYPENPGRFFTAIIHLSCDNIEMRLTDTNDYCSSAIYIHGAHIAPYDISSSYDINDDSELIFNVVDFYIDGGCSIDPKVMTIKLTKCIGPCN